MLACGVVGILAAAVSLSPAFACGGEETWLTDEEIATARAGGDVPKRYFGVQYTRPTLPEIPFVSPVVVDPIVEPDAVDAARSSLTAAADEPFETVLAAVPVEHRSPNEPASNDVPSNMKRVFIACDGTVLVSPSLL